MLQLEENQELRIARWDEHNYELIIRTFDTYSGATKHVHPTGIKMQDLDMDTMKHMRSQVLTAFADEVIMCRKVK